MKKIIAYIITAVLIMGCFSACSTNGNTDKGSTGTSKKVSIVTTIFPEYDWVMNVLGTNPANADVTMLLDNGVDLHSYQPTADDILKISTCDLFIYVGGESDEWVEDALKEALNKNMVVLNLLDILGESVKEEEVVEGMQAEDEHDHHHDDEDEDHEDHEHEDHEHEEEIEYDEHVWLSLKNAEKIVNSIGNALEGIDSANAGTYKANAAAYIEKLKSLDGEFQKAVSASSIKTLLFGDRFPFRYLVDDYGISYYAAFVGCSAETEASFETITFLSKKMDELSLKAVMTIEGSDHRIAETIVRNTSSKDQKILTLDSMQSVTSKDITNGVTYLSIMEKDLSILKEALK